MVKLESQDTTFGGVFYFYNMNDCREFIDVFENHWCNIPWKTPVEISDNTCLNFEEKKYMDISPKKEPRKICLGVFALKKVLE